MDDQAPSGQNADKPSGGPLIPDAVQPINAQATSDTAAQQLAKGEKEMSGFEKSTLRWAKTAVIMSGLAALFVCGQWYEMHEGGADTHNLATAAGTQAAQTTNLATSAGTQATAAGGFAKSASEIDTKIALAEQDFARMAKNSEDAIKATQESMRQDQRAWLGAGDYTYTLAESGPIESVANLTNTGKSPALNILCRITGTTKLKDYVLRDSDIVYPQELPTLRQGALFPNQHFPLKATGPPMDPEKQKVWFGNIQSGEWIEYFFGEVRYIDTLGKNHWTHFCTQYIAPTKSGTPCPVYNDAGDEEPANPN
ncbi:lysozyme inhibitor LprI family protein [Terracidiphilus gabretensis]|uniref:hypothetical protein n=1 Tax=Terracidiphilus gabretensis TaxID=1577687 RepID=UPI00071B3C60|nr:hypothetical protein [Terracidiphilus gabretensis]